MYILSKIIIPHITKCFKNPSWEHHILFQYDKMISWSVNILKKYFKEKASPVPLIKNGFHIKTFMNGKEMKSPIISFPKNYIEKTLNQHLTQELYPDPSVLIFLTRSTSCDNLIPSLTVIFSVWFVTGLKTGRILSIESFKNCADSFKSVF